MPRAKDCVSETPEPAGTVHQDHGVRGRDHPVLAVGTDEPAGFFLEFGTAIVGTKRLKPGPKPRAAREAKIQRAAVEELRRRDIVRRLLEALDKRLIHLETRMAPDAERRAHAERGRRRARCAHLERARAPLREARRARRQRERARERTIKTRARRSRRRPTMRTNSAAILRSAFSDSIRHGTLEDFLCRLERRRAATPALRFRALGARRSIAAGFRCAAADRGPSG